MIVRPNSSNGPSIAPSHGREAYCSAGPSRKRRRTAGAPCERPPGRIDRDGRFAAQVVWPDIVEAQNVVGVAMRIDHRIQAIDCRPRWPAGGSPVWYRSPRYGPCRTASGKAAVRLSFGSEESHTAQWQPSVGTPRMCRSREPSGAANPFRLVGCLKLRARFTREHAGQRRGLMQRRRAKRYGLTLAFFIMASAAAF